MQLLRQPDAQPYEIVRLPENPLRHLTHCLSFLCLWPKFYASNTLWRRLTETLVTAIGLSVYQAFLLRSFAVRSVSLLVCQAQQMCLHCSVSRSLLMLVDTLLNLLFNTLSPHRSQRFIGWPGVRIRTVLSTAMKYSTRIQYNAIVPSP